MGRKFLRDLKLTKSITLVLSFFKSVVQVIPLGLFTGQVNSLFFLLIVVLHLPAHRPLLYSIAFKSILAINGYATQFYVFISLSSAAKTTVTDIFIETNFREE
jgi:hypothetical protein